MQCFWMCRIGYEIVREQGVNNSVAARERVLRREKMLSQYDAVGRSQDVVRRARAHVAI